MADKKCAIITGGGRGIGLAVAVKLAKMGMDIVISYVGDPATNETAEAAVRAEGAEFLAVPADASRPEEAVTLVQAALDTFGRVDVLINNAGITRDKLAMRMKPEDFDAVISVNLAGAFYTSKAVLKPMMSARSGRIINMSSVVALRGNAGQVNYSASKAGLIGMTKSLAREVASRGITVNAVAPGFIKTAMTDAMPERAREATLATIPAGHMGEPEDIANAIGFLASDEAAYITGQVLAVDGGMAM